tara:strand:- start:6561 stop:7088 length:528 start_codon:yes stop_codon:yes gene_type:complete
MGAIKSESLLRAQIEVSVEKTRPANTTAYTNEDVVSESDSAGTAWTFDAVVPTPGGSGRITKAIVLDDDTADAPVMTMYLTNVTPTGNLDDNGANTNPVYATEGDNYQGRLDWAALEDLGGPSEAVLNEADTKLPLPFVCAAGDDALYGVLVIRSAAHTPSSGQKWRVTLTIEPD